LKNEEKIYHRDSREAAKDTEKKKKGQKYKSGTVKEWKSEWRGRVLASGGK